MKAELRETLGKVVHQALGDEAYYYGKAWAEIPEEGREHYEQVGEAVAHELLGMIVNAVEMFKSAIIESVDGKGASDE